jgi:hypothetical protein
VSDGPVIIPSDGSRRFTGTMVDPEAGFTLNLPPTDLSYICIDYRSRLWFDATEVAIGGPFVLSTPSTSHRLDSEQRGHLGPLLALYPDRLDAATVGIDATLTLAFSSGATITVEPDEHYESWEVTGPGTTA